MRDSLKGRGPWPRTSVLASLLLSSLVVYQSRDLLDGKSAGQTSSQTHQDIKTGEADQKGSDARPVLEKAVEPAGCKRLPETDQQYQGYRQH